MSFSRVFSLLLVGTLVCCFGSESFAQGFGNRGPLRRAGKWLGGGWGNGNHWRNPSVNSGYYNPYTAHNSSLLTGVHPDAARFSFGNSGWKVVEGVATDRGVFTPAPKNPVPPVPPQAPQTPVEKPEHPAAIDAQPEPSKPATPMPEADGGKGEVDGTTALLEQAFEAHRSPEGTGLFEEPVIGDRDYQPNVQSKPEDAFEVDANNFWKDD